MQQGRGTSTGSQVGEQVVGSPVPVSERKVIALRVACGSRRSEPRRGERFHLDTHTGAEPQASGSTWTPDEHRKTRRDFFAVTQRHRRTCAAMGNSFRFRSTTQLSGRRQPGRDRRRPTYDAPFCSKTNSGMGLPPETSTDRRATPWRLRAVASSRVSDPGLQIDSRLKTILRTKCACQDYFPNYFLPGAATLAVSRERTAYRFLPRIRRHQSSITFQRTNRFS